MYDLLDYFLRVVSMHTEEITGCIEDMEELVDSMFGDAKVVFKGGEGEGVSSSVARLSSSMY